MKKMRNGKLLCLVVMLAVLQGYAGVYTGNSDWQSPFDPDQYTLGLWHFDEQAGTNTLTDASGNSPDGTMVNGLDPAKTWKASMSAEFGNCASTWWNSSTDYNYGSFKIDLANVSPDPLAVGKDKDVTIEFWAKYQYASNRMLIDKATLGDYMVHDSGGKLAFGWYGSEGNYINTYGPDIQLGQWAHYAVTANRTSHPDKDVVTFWLNGVQQGEPMEVSSHVITDFVGDLYLLSTASGTNVTLTDIDELRISDTIRYIPEPATVSLLISGCLFLARRRK